MPAAELVVLDIGNTLVTGPDRGPAKRIAAALGLDEPARRALQDMLMTIDFADPAEIATFLGRDDAEEAIEDVWIAQQSEPVPVPGAIEKLSELVEAGLTLAVLSNIWQPYLAGVLDHFGDAFDQLVAFRAYSFATGVAKPDPLAFTALLDVAGVPADRSVMVGDTYDTDIAPARELGMKTIWIGHDVASVADIDVEDL